MTPAERLLALVAEGRDLLERERALLLRGAFAELAELAGAKSALLEALDGLAGQVRGTEEVRAALTGLIAESRRNERLIEAARQGVGTARRRLGAIAATRQGAVAYDRDGSAIGSREDAISESSRA